MMQVDYFDVWDTIDLGKRRIPIITIRGEEPGPTIWLVANAHGNEVTGVAVIHRLLDRFQAHGLRRGTIHALPLMNPMGAELIQRNMPADNENLNRCYPGSATGGVTERLAHRIYTHIIDTKPNFVVDLHTTASRSLPYIILDRVTAETAEGDDLARHLQEHAEIFGVSVVYDYPLAEYIKAKLDRSLPGALLNHAHIPAFTVELGPTFIIEDDFIDVGVHGIDNLLHHWEMIDATTAQQWTHGSKITADTALRRDGGVCANQTGWLEFLVRPGQAVKAGQPLARIRDILGRVTEDVLAPHAGHVIELVDRAVVFPGSPLLDLAVPDDAGPLRATTHGRHTQHNDTSSTPHADPTRDTSTPPSAESEGDTETHRHRDEHLVASSHATHKRDHTRHDGR